MFSLRGKENRSGFSRVNYVLLIFTLAVVWRVIQLVHYKMIGTDDAYYASIARFFAEGYWERALDPYWSPFYPFLVSLPFRLGISLEASGIAISLLASAGSVILCFFLAKLIAGPRVGIIAAAIAAIHPRLVIISQTFMTEALYLFLACGALALFCYKFNASILSRKKLSIVIFFFIGFILSLAYLTRPEGIFCFALLFVLCIANLTLKKYLSSNLFHSKLLAGIMPCPLLCSSDFWQHLSLIFITLQELKEDCFLEKRVQLTFMVPIRMIISKLE